jgi:beta-galactosidase
MLEKLSEANGIATMQVKLLDNKGVLCLDAANWVRFSLAGDGKLIDNQGTSSGSRLVQVYNGRAIIRVQTNGGKSVLGVKSEGLKTVFKDL